MRVMGQLQHKDLEAFEVWYRYRTFAEVSRQFHVTNSAVQVHAAKHKWEDRAKARDERLAKQMEKTLTERLIEDAVSHYDLLQRAAKQVDLALKEQEEIGKPMKAHPLLFYTEAMEKIIKNQKLLAGEPTENIQYTLKDFIMSITTAVTQKGAALELKVGAAKNGNGHCLNGGAPPEAANGPQILPG